MFGVNASVEGQSVPSYVQAALDSAQPSGRLTASNAADFIGPGSLQ